VGGGIPLNEERARRHVLVRFVPHETKALL
jgi:hypothetical protein